MGLLIAEPGLYPLLTGWENLHFFGALYGLEHRATTTRVQPLLDRLGLSPHMASRVGAWSSGMKQKASLVRALLMSPKLLLLDEPSLGLAPQVVQDVAALIREINQEGVSVLLVEQNASMALQLADYGYLMENGRVVLDGTADALREDEDVREFYLGLGGGKKSYREVKLYRRRKRWLS